MIRLPDMWDMAFYDLLRSGVLPFGCALVVVWLVLGLSSRPMRRLGEESHWSVVALKFWNVRVARIYAMIWIVVFAFSLPPGRSESPWAGLLPALAAGLGCGLGAKLATRGLRVPAVADGGWMRGLVARSFLFPAGPTIFLIMVLTWNDGLTTRSWMIAAGFLVLDFALVMGGSVALLRALGLLKPMGDPDRNQVIREQAEKQGVPIRGVFEVALPSVNAFAFPWTRDVAFTVSAMRVLDDAEVRSVAAHELGHLKGKTSIRWMMFAGLPSLVMIGLAPAAMRSGLPLVGLGFFLLHVAVARLLARISRKFEHEADAEAKTGEHEDGVYARALEKIHESNLIPAVIPPNASHPSLYDRMLAAGVAPDFPKPPAPSRTMPMVLGMLAALLFFAGFRFLELAIRKWM